MRAKNGTYIMTLNTIQENAREKHEENEESTNSVLIVGASTKAACELGTIEKKKSELDHAEEDVRNRVNVPLFISRASSYCQLSISDCLEMTSTFHQGRIFSHL